MCNIRQFVDIVAWVLQHISNKYYVFRHHTQIDLSPPKKIFLDFSFEMCAEKYCWPHRNGSQNSALKGNGWLVCKFSTVLQALVTGLQRARLSWKRVMSHALHLSELCNIWIKMWLHLWGCLLTFPGHCRAYVTRPISLDEAD